MFCSSEFKEVETHSPLLDNDHYVLNESFSDVRKKENLCYQWDMSA